MWAHLSYRLYKLWLIRHFLIYIILLNYIMDYKHDFKNDEFADKYIFKHKLNGYFVEIGACDGVNSSQCYFF